VIVDCWTGIAVWSDTKRGSNHWHDLQESYHQKEKSLVRFEKQMTQ
jgi:hypothetical protein